MLNALKSMVLSFPATIAGMRHGLGRVNLIQDESGQDLIEYALVAALIGVGAIIALRGLSTKIASAFTSVGNNLTSNV
ncbi:Flp pilus assembly protein, pilin Flp [Granulicella rosea]|uniref:Flp pilus assembly protein, pilin Flp n=1 Tax=Granulicella rosea TaxID=474952 RepID=A0A239D2Q0_9BACT|nr:Flp pilus assembly protein, pilin Flp [Granulicella rosea]